jgi:hypothetical protein
MYYFRYGGQNHSSIRVKAREFESGLDGELVIKLEDKQGLIIKLHEIDDYMSVVKKSSDLYASIVNALDQEQWDKFIIDDMILDGFANEDEEIINTQLALFSHQSKNKKNTKDNPYSKWTAGLSRFSLPEIEPDDIIMKKKNAPWTHVYYRKDSVIYHVCLDDNDLTVFSFEIFGKVSG